MSLEAIFLSTFVTISQNRADERRQVLADNQWLIVQTEAENENCSTRPIQQILELTTAIHKMTSSIAPAVGEPG